MLITFKKTQAGMSVLHKNMLVLTFYYRERKSDNKPHFSLFAA